MKKKVLIFTDWFLPAYKAGGPVRSIANIVEHLKDEFEFYIVTSDRDLGDDEAYEGIEVDSWLDRDFGKIQYLSPGKTKLNYFSQILSEVKPNMVYLNSMFSFKFSILPLLSANKSRSIDKIILAPRGMLGKGALDIKPLRKKVFLTIGNFIGLFRKIQWHATSDEEKKEIEAVFGKNAKVTVAKNIPQEFKVTERSKSKNALNLLFYSRISTKKNLLEGLKMLEKAQFDGELRLEIVGPIESQEYWGACQEVITRIEKSTKNLSVQVLGSVNPNKAHDLFSRNQLFFLPTRHENFGHVIAEALSSSMPVLISDQTPWRNLEENKAGMDIALTNEEAFMVAINRFLVMDQNEYDQWSKGARAYFEQQIDVDSIVNDTRNVFLKS